MRRRRSADLRAPRPLGRLFNRPVDSAFTETLPRRLRRTVATAVHAHFELRAPLRLQRLKPRLARTPLGPEVGHGIVKAEPATLLAPRRLPLLTVSVVLVRGVTPHFRPPDRRLIRGRTGVLAVPRHIEGREPLGATGRDVAEAVHQLAHVQTEPAPSTRSCRAW